MDTRLSCLWTCLVPNKPCETAGRVGICTRLTIKLVTKRIGCTSIIALILHRLKVDMRHMPHRLLQDEVSGP